MSSGVSLGRRKSFNARMNVETRPMCVRTQRVQRTERRRAQGLDPTLACRMLALTRLVFRGYSCLQDRRCLRLRGEWQREGLPELWLVVW